MILTFTARTKKNCPYINTATFRCNGKEIVIDRNKTRTCFNKESGFIQMEWKGIYIWNGEEANYHVPFSLFDEAVLVKVEIDGINQNGNDFQILSCSVTDEKKIKVKIKEEKK